MKKNLFYFLFAATMLTIGFSCSSDDDGPTPPEEDVLVGTWQLTNIDFIHMEEGGFPASDACIWELVSFYEFKADGKFYYLLTDTAPPIFDPYANEYWNWIGDETDFNVTQLNPMSPPYNFGIHPTDVSAVKADGQWTITFTSDLSNGSKAKFTIRKKDIDLSLKPAVTDDQGNPYVCDFFGG